MVDAGVGGIYVDSGLVTKPPPSGVSVMGERDVKMSKVDDDGEEVIGRAGGCSLRCGRRPYILR